MKEWTAMEGMRVLKTEASGSAEIPSNFTEEDAADAAHFHASIDSYRATPLQALKGLAAKLGVKGIYVKDESKRFSLNAFKGLGGSYAMFRIFCDRLELDPAKTVLSDLLTEENRHRVENIEFVTATDGNHGRGVSWAAGIFGCRAHVFMPYGSEEVRAEAIRKVGPAEVEITALSYDDTVKLASEKAESYGWILIQDTAWDEYEQIPAWIIQGYLTMASEAAAQLAEVQEVPTHVFLQAGVGAMAGGVLGYLVNHYREQKPIVTVVEPAVADCIYQSKRAEDGAAHSVEGAPTTIMAGLNCGTPCKITWPVLRDYAEFAVSGADYMAAVGMRTYAAPVGGDQAVVSGESGAATMGAVALILSRPELAEVREEMQLNAESVILLISTEGDTDPENYRRVVTGEAYPAPEA